LLVAPFVLLADPTPGSWGGGAALALLGLLVRGWAAGCVEKDRRLCVVGPYAFTRNPLYLGSLLLGAGAAIAGRSWLWALLLALLLASSYPRVIRVEETRLAERFGGAFAEYRDRVPRYLPRIRPWRGGGAAEGRFSPRRCLEHREWNAWLGAGACFAWLALLAW